MWWEHLCMLYFTVTTVLESRPKELAALLSAVYHYNNHTGFLYSTVRFPMMSQPVCFIKLDTSPIIKHIVSLHQHFRIVVAKLLHLSAVCFWLSYLLSYSLSDFPLSAVSKRLWWHHWLLCLNDKKNPLTVGDRFKLTWFRCHQAS